MIYETKNENVLYNYTKVMDHVTKCQTDLMSDADTTLIDWNKMAVAQCNEIDVVMCRIHFFIFI